MADVQGPGPNPMAPSPDLKHPPPPDRGSWLDLLPVAWLLLALAGYALLALQPTLFPDLRLPDEVPGILELERLVLPLLAALLITAAWRRRRQVLGGRCEERPS